MKSLNTFAGVAFFALVGCGSSGDTTSMPPPEKTNDPGKMMMGGDPNAPEYPKGKLGFGRGDQIANLSFLIHKNGTKDAGTDPVKVTLADYYAMRKDGVKLVYLSGAAEWCGPCNLEADGLQAAVGAQDFQDAAKQIQIVQVVIQNQDGSPSDRSTIDRWAQAHKITFNVGIDPKQDVQKYIPANSIPQSIFINVSDMTILATENGFPGNDAIKATLRDYLAKTH